MKKVSIIVVEDHQLIREMWASLFANNNEMEVVGEAGNFDDAISIIKTVQPDIVLLDINLPEGSGMDAMPLIKQYAPATKVIAVSMHNQPAYAKKMLQIGARAYVTKNSSYQEILKAVEEVLQGKTYICKEIKDNLSGQMLGDERPDIKDLSLREIEIVKLIKEGLSSKEIAERLNIAVRTAEVHRHNILRKLGFKNTASLIKFINTTDLSFL